MTTEQRQALARAIDVLQVDLAAYAGKVRELEHSWMVSPSKALTRRIADLEGHVAQLRRDISILTNMYEEGDGL